MVASALSPERQLERLSERVIDHMANNDIGRAANMQPAGEDPVAS
jgi:hypothetical protein